MSAPDGWRLFARYAYAPNARGYCGPPEAAALEAVARGGGEEVDVPALARRFSGAWPYHVLIAELAGIGEPLDPRVGRAYWTGSELTHSVDARRLGELLIERFLASAGHYWQHLGPDLLEEITPTHAFHVLGVYPWSRLLAGGRPEPLQVLNSCLIRPAELLDAAGGRAVVRSRSLRWDGRRLSLSRACVEEATIWQGSACGGTEAQAFTALHWGHACDLLNAAEHRDLEHWIEVQVEATNRRLSLRQIAAAR